MNEWRSVALGDIALIGAGNAAPQAPELFENGSIPFIRTSDVGRIKFGRIGSAEDLLNDAGAKGLKMWPRGTILFPKSGASTFLNHRVVMDVEGCVASHLATIVPNPSKVVGRFVHYFLHTIRAQDLTQDHNYPSLRLPEIGAIQVPLPPLDEQKRIVAILDEALEGVAKATANAKKNLLNAGDLAKGWLSGALSPQADEWRAAKISQLVDEGILDRPIDGNHGEIHPKKADFVDSGVPFIMASDLVDGEVDQDGCSFITETQARSLRKGFARDGDVLLSHKGTIGRVAILSTHRPFVILTPQVTYYRSLRPDVLDQNFLYFALQDFEFQSELANIAGAGSTRAYIGITRQLDLTIKYPRAERQRQIVAQLEAVSIDSRRLQELYRGRTLALSELKQALLHKAFTGQLASADNIAA